VFEHFTLNKVTFLEFMVKLIERIL